MMRFWPRFHDPALRLTLPQRWRVHWRANLLMLRCPRDLIIFTAWTMGPVVLLFVLVESVPQVFSANANDPADINRLLLVSLLTLAVFFGIQHVVFVAAMQQTYVPHVRRALVERGIPVCLDCGQLLPPETPGARCPECGSDRGSATMTNRPKVPPSARQEPPR